MTEKPRAGWESTFNDFREAPPKCIREALSAYIAGASPEQVRAWDDAIPPLQRQVEHTLIRDELASRYSAILEYELPMESRRPDVILLVGADVVVIELKGKRFPSQADLDQASAYARDLRNYHRECAGRVVTAVLVPTLASGFQQEVDGILVTGPDALDSIVAELTKDRREPLPAAGRLRHRVRCSGPRARRRAAGLGYRSPVDRHRVVERTCPRLSQQGADSRSVPAPRERVSSAPHPKSGRHGHLRARTSRARRDASETHGSRRTIARRAKSMSRQPLIWR